ncbi:FAD binding domain-containing protein [Virgibacillus halophilus]|uniref:FAD binding domain-containing protein n=1 Tax=Tigheibacillus halophilus TaxID=361280 RepID=A0ABU5C395_9BACI|nr:FAD binding domain-containing protein [Virgibacillus halophilus]
MNGKGSIKLQGNKETVFTSLLDPDVLRNCIMGCKELIQQEENVYKVDLSVGVAAVKGKYDATMRLADVSVPESYKLIVHGEGGPGFVDAEAEIHLVDVDDSKTELTYTYEAQVGGKVAAIGQRMLGGVAKLIINDFFKKIKKRVGENECLGRRTSLMKPAVFSYLCPSTLEETIDMLTEYGDEGKIIAGGQSFVPILNMRMSEPEYLIDIHQLEELRGIRLEGESVKIGALTTQRELEKNTLIMECFPVLKEAVRFIGHVQTRNRGTVGGSLAHADPSAELPLSFLALNAEIIVQSTSDERIADINEFFLTYLTTDMMPDEILTEIQVPLNQPKGYAFEEFSRRHGDFALVSVVCLLSTDEAGKIESVRLALGGN